MTDLKRLGKRGAYGLGQLATQGDCPQRPTPFQPRFVRPDHRWPGPVWLLALLTGVLIIVGAAAVGWWFMPFVIGLGAGLANYVGRWPTRLALPAVALASAAGWVVPLLWSVLSGTQYGGVARTAALLGLPQYAAAGIALTVLVPVAQGITGYWLGRALTPMPTEDDALAAVPVSPPEPSRGRHAARRGR
jgi:hypothetical protein